MERNTLSLYMEIQQIILKSKSEIFNEKHVSSMNELLGIIFLNFIFSSSPCGRFLSSLLPRIIRRIISRLVLILG